MSCQHLSEAGAAEARTPDECEDCVADGETYWVHLRTCLSCGQVGCCDSSPNQHASKHFASTGHPVIRSAQPGEAWRWCFVDEEIG
ncbi:UBP-type zinc finger domain-containing protein [Micromonospora sp. LAH09]|uniref:UBP-type zinc finger domain-containing protein n=1 Tax=Micromonospora cabrerizensis TaxID=2911213 RepID=UPI001EE7D1B2|nr:UBP-type zinc finger domain-containing protein [Micromonospora cabrerizensis]MCG5470344.1 UBP-type zinc finger domain-containing protein [Micromonospora cabrerizensis]